MDALGLPLDAEPMEVLARSHGQRVGDLIELLPDPEAAAGQVVDFTSCSWHPLPLRKTEQNRIRSLSAGEQLLLRRDSENRSSEGLLGHSTWRTSARLAAGFLDRCCRSMEDRQLAVERANGPKSASISAPGLGLRNGLARQANVSGPRWETV